MTPDGTRAFAELSMWRERLFGQPLLIEPWAAASILGALADNLGVSSIDVLRFGELHHFEPALLADMAPRVADRREYQVQDGVAVIPVTGKLVNRSAYLRPPSGLTGYNAVGEALDQALADPAVKGVALEIDSPGGEASGSFDLWNRVSRAKGGGKPIWAVVYNQAASSAYGLASAADRVVAPEFGSVGSVGVVGLHADLSGALAQKGVKVTVLQAGERKTDGSPFDALPPEVAQRWQGKLDALYQRFVGMVAANRGMTQKAVRATEGETLYGRDAKDVGLVDALAPPHEALAEFTQFVNRGASRSARGAGMAAPTNGAAVEAAADHIHGSMAPATEGRPPNEGGAIQGRALSWPPEQIAAARAEGREDGVAAERARVSTILRCEQADGRAETALSLALDTDLTAEQAVKVLGATPKVAAGPQKVEVVAAATDFERHMSSVRNPQVGVEMSEDDELGALAARFRQREGRAS